MYFACMSITDRTHNTLLPPPVPTTAAHLWSTTKPVGPFSCRRDASSSLRQLELNGFRWCLRVAKGTIHGWNLCHRRETMRRRPRVHTTSWCGALAEHIMTWTSWRSCLNCKPRWLLYSLTFCVARRQAAPLLGAAWLAIVEVDEQAVVQWRGNHLEDREYEREFFKSKKVERRAWRAERSVEDRHSGRICWTVDTQPRLRRWLDILSTTSSEYTDNYGDNDWENYFVCIYLFYYQVLASIYLSSI
jgi:hypothetical protein